MSNSFSFAEFIPEPLTYKDDVLGGDGTIYDVQVGDLLSTEAIVQFTRLEKQVRGLQTGAEQEDAVVQIDQLVSQMLAILIPGLPAERLAAIPLQLKMKFAEWWRSEQGKAKGGESTPPNAS